MYFKKLKKYLFILLLFIILFFVIKNILYQTVNELSHNLTIRDNLLESNSYLNKGTHLDAVNLFLTLRKDNINMIINLDYKKFIKKINLYKKKPYNNYLKEISILDNLLKLSFKNQNFRKESIIYIPRNIESFWKLSCDTHMMPLLIPSFSNIVTFGSLPDLELKSCFGHLLEYGYYQYYLQGKKYDKY